MPDLIEVEHVSFSFTEEKLRFRECKQAGQTYTPSKYQRTLVNHAVTSKSKLVVVKSENSYNQKINIKHFS